MTSQSNSTAINFNDGHDETVSSGYKNLNHRALASTSNPMSLQWNSPNMHSDDEHRKILQSRHSLRSCRLPLTPENSPVSSRSSSPGMCSDGEHEKIFQSRCSFRNRRSPASASSPSTMSRSCSPAICSDDRRNEILSPKYIWIKYNNSPSTANSATTMLLNLPEINSKGSVILGNLGTEPANSSMRSRSISPVICSAEGHPKIFALSPRTSAYNRKTLRLNSPSMTDSNEGHAETTAPRPEAERRRKRRRSMSHSTFKLPIKRVRKIVCPDMKLSRLTLEDMNNFVTDMMRNLDLDLRNLSDQKRRKTLGIDQIECALKLRLSPKIYKFASEFAQNTMLTFNKNSK